MNKMKIYLDFDGTVVEHQYPGIGRCNFGCMEVIKKLQDAGHEIILNTYRVEVQDGSLEKALDYLNNKRWMFFKDRREMDKEYTLITKFTENKIPPPSWERMLSEDFKQGVIYIDDMAPGIPLKPCVMSSGYMVDWYKLDQIFMDLKLY